MNDNGKWPYGIMETIVLLILVGFGLFMAAQGIILIVELAGG